MTGTDGTAGPGVATGRVGVVCVLHGDPEVPGWLFALARAVPLVLVVNDPGPGRYARLPAAATTLVNDEPAGFAVNVDRGVDALLEAAPVDVLLSVNFDLELEPGVVDTLVAALDRHPEVAAVGPLLTGYDGEPVFSSGRLPRPALEFLRAAGLRQGRLLQWQRLLLRRSAAWRERNSGAARAGASSAPVRLLQDGEYLPWTCVAVRRAAWTSVGPLDRRFRLYAEDIDWSVRAVAAGWRLGLVTPDTPVLHAERWTRSPTTDAWYEASHVRLHRKHGWTASGRAQRAGLALRRWTPLRWVSPLVWSETRR
ncbi:glycosyltransferase family 2 protein [Modestobacter marinus]|uniref:glycosyltransferase family 2 protein n=1 Tax=Modestobacter marinus TaxID=477641 RepID=UPI00201A8846|nr:glycosyltransferase family 2 protein [Modestobacter marinus]